MKSPMQQGRDTFLASAGAAEVGRERLTDKMDDLYTQGNSLVSDLLERGVQVEQQLKSQLDKLPLPSIDSLLEKLSPCAVRQEKQLDKLSNKVDALIEAVAKLAEARAAQQQATAAAEPAAKATTRTTRTTTAKATVNEAATAKSTAVKRTPNKTTASRPARTSAAKPRTRAKSTPASE